MIEISGQNIKTYKEGKGLNLDQAKIIDITPVISPDLAVFPGDTPFSREILMDFPKDHLGLSTIKTTVHLGAHTDAPNHYHEDGVGISDRDLSLYYGKCQVIEVSLPRGERISPDHFEDKISAPRVLFKTNSYPDPNEWNDDFNSLSPELINYLSEKGVRLVGIDTPSVDPASEKELSSHHEIFKKDMGILEGVVLKNVIPGIYRLIALPLRIKDADASPVRAVLEVL